VGGTITAIQGDSITLKTMQGETATVKVTADTRYRKGREDAKFSDLKVGDHIGVRGEKTGENTFSAQAVMIAPPGGFQGGMGGPGGGMGGRELGQNFIAGEVKKIEGTKLTILRPDGETQVIQADEQTSFLNDKRESITLADIKVGDKVRGPGELKNGIFVPARLMIGEFPQGRMGRRRPQ
jgi:hypothetical protein